MGLLYLKSTTLPIVIAYWLRPGREVFITRLGLGAHDGANGLVPLLPTSLREPDKTICIAPVERHVEKCAMIKTLLGVF